MPGRLIDELTRRALLSPDQVTLLLKHHERFGGPLDTSILELGLVSEADISAAMASAYGLAVASAKDLSTPIEPQTARAFPEQWAKRHVLAPLTHDVPNATMTMLVAAPPNLSLLAELGELLDLALRPLLTLEIRVRQRLHLLYEAPPPPRVAALLERSPDGPKPAPARQRPRLGPMSFAEVTHRLHTATSRDDVVDLALAYAQNEFELAALFTVRGPKITGWAAVGPGSDRVGDVEIPRGARSSFWLATATEAHHLGPLESQDADHLAPLGRDLPRAALIVPIRVKNRIVALLYAENGPRAIPPRLAADAMILATHVQQALESVLMRSKRVSMPPPPRAAAPLPPIPARANGPISAFSSNSASSAYSTNDRGPPIPPRARELTPAPFRPPTQPPASSGAEPASASRISDHATEDLEPVLESAGRASRPPGRFLQPAVIDPSESASEILRRRRSPVPAHLVSEPPPEQVESERPLRSNRPRMSELPPFRLPAAESPGAVRRPALDALSLFPKTAADEPTTDRLAVEENEKPQAIGEPPSLDEVDTLDEPQRPVEPTGTSALEPPTLDERPSDPSPRTRAALKVEAWADASAARTSAPWGDSNSGRTPVPRLDSAPPIVGFDGDTAPLIRPTGERMEELSRALQQINEALSTPPPRPIVETRRTAWPALAGPSDDTLPEVPAMNPHALAALPVSSDLDIPVLDPVFDPSEPPDELDDRVSLSRPAHLVNQTGDLLVQVTPYLGDDMPEATDVDDATLVEVLPAMKGALEPEVPEPEPPSLLELASVHDAEPVEEPQVVAEVLATPLARIRPRKESSEDQPEPWESALIAAPPEPARPPPPPAPSSPVHVARPEVPEERPEDRGLPVPSVGQGASPPPAAVTLRDRRPEPEKLVIPRPAEAIAEPARNRAAELDELIEKITEELRPAKEVADKLHALGESVIPRLIEKFPGRVRFDAMVVKRLPPISDCGPLVSLLARFGRVAHPYVAKLLDAPEPLVRVWAVHFYASVHVPDVVPLLARRLNDEVDQVPVHTVAALVSYRPSAEYTAVVENLRIRLAAPSSDTRARAIFALGGLRDHESVPLLAEIFNDKDKRLTQLAEDALAEITKQRLGPNHKKWLRWYAKNERIPRPEWLLEGLKSDEAALRKSALEELRALSGLDIPFDPAGPKKEREIGRKAFVKWWAESKS
ncbi:MAG: hypothetical protein HY791_19330 [Deltaproteobacteria bacterium]|nr:hypothetical protein [Deltaproteobacteria bacterium]